MRRRVAVTGAGAESPLGDDWKRVRERLRAGSSAVVRIDAWDGVEGLATRVAAPVPGFRTPEHYPRKKTRSMGRVSLLSVRAAEGALREAGLLGDEALGSGRAGVAFGSSAGSPAGIVVYAKQLWIGQTTRGIGANDFLQFMSHTTAANVAQFFGVRGRLLPTSSACTSGSQAIGFAAEAIRFGQQDVMLAGGAEELDVMDAAVFDVLYAASTRNDDPAHTPRPFDASRDGMVVGEGAGCLVLEDWERARARGAPILAELVGFGTNCDGRHLTNPDAAGMEQVMRLALADAGLEPGDIGYVNAHGTATEVGDIAESQATHAVFGARVPVSTLKGHMAHTLGACGALEAWMTLAMQREGWVAPTLHLEEPDPRCAPLDFVRGQPRPLQAEFAMSNNFAFGGVNTSLVFRRADA